MITIELVHTYMEFLLVDNWQATLTTIAAIPFSLMNTNTVQNKE